MPQLDFHNPLTIAQVVWMALIFGALYLLLARWALPQVASVLDERAGRIAADLDAARAAKAQADAAVAELQQATSQASAAAQSSIAGAVAAAKAEAAEQAHAATARLDAQLAEAEQRIGAARVAAMGALRDVAAETATAIVDRLTGLVTDPALVRTEVGHALAARG
jgi:F-type H+-transporting ATPase subunit b